MEIPGYFFTVLQYLITKRGFGARHSRDRKRLLALRTNDGFAFRAGRIRLSGFTMWALDVKHLPGIYY